MIIKRFLKIQLPLGQSCFLWGARKTGKSTHLKDQFKDALYINLLETDVLRSFMKQPERLRQEILLHNDRKVIIIDEIQKIPALLDEVHTLIENYKEISFILCGSSVKRLKSTGANLLGGRAWRYLFQPLCYPELQELNWKKIFNQGLLPAHYLAKSKVEKTLCSYLYDYILPEVQYEANLRNRDAFARFLDLVGISNGEIIIYNNIARDCGVDAKTIKTYFEILEDMYLGYYVHPFRSQIKRQILTEAPKFYFFDTGLANYLRSYTFQEMIGVEAGRAFEHYIYLELKAYQNLCEKRDTINYWRTKEGHEVDFIFKNNAIEIKLTNSVDAKHLKGLCVFSEEHDHNLHVVCMEPRKRLLTLDGKNVLIWPVEDFLKSLWNHEIWT